MGRSIKNEQGLDTMWMVSEPVLNPSDVVSRKAFAKMLGETEDVVRGMIEAGKVPVVEMRDPQKPSARAKYWIYLPAWNAGMKLAFDSRPKEIRDGWLTWLGLSV